MSTVIRTQNPLLPATLRAIAVCWWALLADCLVGMRGVAGQLWAGYRQACAEQRAAQMAAADEVDELLAQLDERDASPLDEFAREFGRPGWLSATVMAVVVSAVAIELLGGWQLLADAVGTALQLLARG